MEMTIGAQGTDWGSVADWFSVVVNVFVGLSVFWLGRRTYELTQSATLRDDKAHLAKNEQEKREGNLLLSLFRPEIGHFRIQLERSLRRLDRDAEAVQPYFCGREFLELINGLDLPSVWSKQGRLHILPDEKAVILVSLIGSILPLKQIAAGSVATQEEEKAKADAILRDSIARLIKASRYAEAFCEEAKKAFDMPGSLRLETPAVEPETQAA